MHVPHTACTATDVAESRRQQCPLCARVLPCLRAPCPYLRVPFLCAGPTLARALPMPRAFCLHAFAMSLLRATHLPTPCACPTLLIELAMYVMPAVFDGCYYCIFGNTLTIPHALSLSLFCPTLTVCPIIRLTHAWRGPALRTCHVYICVHVYVCVSVV